MINPITLSDGVQLHIIPSNKFTTNIICVLMRLPLSKEHATPTALLPPLLARGSAKYPTVKDIRLAAESLQGSIFDAQIIKKGEQQVLQFFLEGTPECTSESSAQGLEFLTEIILNPHTEGEGFSPFYVSGESENLKNRIKGRINNKSEYAKLICLESMCSKEPFGIYGDGYEEDIPLVTPEGLLSHYHNIRDTYPVDIIALGKWDQNMLKEKIAQKFCKSNSKRNTISGLKLHSARQKPETIRLDYGASQGNLCIGLRGEIPCVGMDFIHFQLLNEILGGGPNAKLFANVREKESLCYAIYSTIYRFKSLMCIIAGAEPDKLEYVYELASNEVKSLKQGQFSEDDLQSAKQSLSKRWRSMQDNPSACVDFYASQYMLNDPSTVDELLTKIHSATKDGITNAASMLDIDTVVVMT